MARKTKSNLTEILNQQINADGTGEHPIIQKITDEKTITAPPEEVYDLMKAFQEQILQMSFSLQNVSEKVSNLIDRVNKFDEASQRFDEDRKKFLEEIQQRAEALKIKNPDEMDKFQAERAVELQKIYQDVRRRISEDEKRRYEKLDREPKVVVRGRGTLELVRKSGGVVEEIVPDAIQIGRRVYVFPPNQDVEVPKSVAEEYFNVLREREILEQRRKLMDGNNPKEYNEVVKRWNDLNQEVSKQSDSLKEYEG